MDRLFNQQNVERYRDLVDARTNRVKRRAILQLLSDEMDQVKHRHPDDAAHWSQA